jgi:hypothetical protein
MSKFGQWLQVLSNVGLLLGIGLVAVQIQQASDITRAQFLASGFESTIRAMDLLVGEHLAEAWGKAMANSDEMTDKDLPVIDAYLRRELLSHVRNEMVSNLGFNDARGLTDATVRKWVFAYLGNETALKWWHGQDPDSSAISLLPDLRSAIDAGLAAQGKEHRRFHARKLEAMRQGEI